MRAPRFRIKTRRKLEVKYGGYSSEEDNMDDGEYVPPRLTRSMTKLANEFNFYVYETYRCMPLLGNEKENAPDWTVHVVNYRVAFVKKKFVG